MRRTLLFLVCFFPALSFGQSKKELIETAFLQSLRKEYVLDSINKRISEANAQIQAVKNSNAVDMPKLDSFRHTVTFFCANKNMIYPIFLIISSFSYVMLVVYFPFASLQGHILLTCL